MYIILYVVAVGCVLVGAAGALYLGNMMLVANGLLAAIAFGSVGKGLHLLTKIEQNLRLSSITAAMRDARRETLARYPAQPQSTAQQGPRAKPKWRAAPRPYRAPLPARRAQDVRR